MATIAHAVFGYLFLLLTVRVLTRRPGGQMTMFEFVLVFLIGGIIILATTGQDRSMTNCITAILTAGLMHRGVSWLKAKSPVIGRWIDGVPLVLVKDGQYVRKIMEAQHVAPQDIMAATRLKGSASIKDVRYAILERNGVISILKAKDK
jgi:uncharacterized membrane protein YcaP (DUF421 family)